MSPIPHLPPVSDVPRAQESAPAGSVFFATKDMGVLHVFVQAAPDVLLARMGAHLADYEREVGEIPPALVAEVDELWPA
jgi:hypothetical protein